VQWFVQAFFLTGNAFAQEIGHVQNHMHGICIGGGRGLCVTPVCNTPILPPNSLGSSHAGIPSEQNATTKMLVHNNISIQ
jgi:hypothetical protein